jgi:hypothetical protein
MRCSEIEGTFVERMKWLLGCNREKEWTEPEFLNIYFHMYPLEADCQEEQREDGWRTLTGYQA